MIAMTKTLKVVSIAIALFATAAGGTAIAGPQANPHGVIYPNTFWGK
jgi:hypothetical protein